MKKLLGIVVLGSLVLTGCETAPASKPKSSPPMGAASAGQAEREASMKDKEAAAAKGKAEFEKKAADDKAKADADKSKPAEPTKAAPGKDK